MTKTDPHPPLANALATHRAEVTRFVRGRVPSDEADDLVQEIFLRAHERRHQLRDPSGARAWLFRIARNAVSDAHRSRARDRAWFAPERAPELELAPPPDPRDACACSLHLAEDLPAGQREILRMVDVGDATLAEAARALGITVNNATVRLHRARASLRKRLSKHCGVESWRACLSCRCLQDRCCPA